MIQSGPDTASKRRQHHAGEPLQADAVSCLSEEQALNWFVALNRATVTDGERMAFNRWLALAPANRQSYQAVLSLWQRLELDSPPSARH